MTDPKNDDGPRKPKPKTPRKPKSPYYKGDNSGGRGNPPISHQFKPGNQGGGRPKGSKSMSSALRKVFTSKVKVRRGDKLVQVPTIEALATRIRDRALTGSDKALFLAQQLANEFGPRDKVSTDVTDQLHSDPETDLTDFTEDKLNILSSLLRRALREKSVGNKSRAAISRIEGYYRLFERDDGYLGIERSDHDDEENYQYDESEF